MVDMARVRALDPVALRAYLGDGNFGGVYQRSDEEMLALWQDRRGRDARPAQRLVGHDGAVRCVASIWGAGAIGGTLGRAPRAKPGTTSRWWTPSSSTSSAINRGGLRVTGPIDEFTARVPAFTPQTLTGTWETIVLATKAHHTGAAVRALAPHLTAGGCVVSAQNGLNELAIAEAVGRRADDGRVRQLRRRLSGTGRDSLRRHAARWSSARSTDASRRACTAVRDAWSDFDSARHRHAEYLGLPVGQRKPTARCSSPRRSPTNRSPTRSRCPSYRPLYIALAREILAVARGSRHPPESFDGFDPSAYLTSAPSGAAERSLDALVAHNRRSAKSHSGIWRDLAVRKRPTEVDAQLGIVVTLGAEAGVPTPLTTRLVELIHEIERGARAQSLDALDGAGSDAGSHTDRA